ncbi:hypothetical protein LT493_41635 [Streptomyces tricolor]|nr:hypothetical protein [Streptomyces tricolor]
MTHESKDGQRPSRRTVLQRGAGVAAAGAATALTGPPAAAHPLPSPGSDAPPEAVAGVRIPDSGPARQAVRLARRVSSETLFHHVMRTYVFGALLFDRRGVRYDRELAFVAAVLHDLGLVEEFRTPAERFEVDGADAGAVSWSGWACRPSAWRWCGTRSPCTPAWGSRRASGRRSPWSPSAPDSTSPATAWSGFRPTPWTPY